MGDVTYDLDLLTQSRHKWENSAGVRTVYRAIFKEALHYAKPGAILEVGAGAGFLKEEFPEVVTSDIAKTPYVEMELSAYEIEDGGRSWSTIVAMDVMHHLRDPFRFFRSASASLEPGGRVVLIEPAGTWWGRCFYRLFHQEPCRPDRVCPPYVFEPDDAAGNFANMGMGWALFQRDRESVGQLLDSSGLKLVEVRFRDVVAYPATGGLSHRQFLPTWLLRWMISLERVLPQWVLAHLGLRMIVVLERRSEPASS